MPCTTLLVGKKASYDGSTMTARNEDSGSTGFTAKKMTVVQPDQQPKVYRSVLSHVEIPLPENPMRYTAMPNANPKDGIWGAAGVNTANVSMTATETLTSNERVLSADPMVRLISAEGGKEEIPGGIGEEDMVTLVLPYIHSAREGVLRLGSLLSQYGTYEMNGIAFQDADEVWWLETIGGHHWIARRVPDECYVVMPNQLGIDAFDLEDAFGEKKEHLCSDDLREFISENHLDLGQDGPFNPRLAFGSRSDADHAYNTPRAWWIERYFNPRTNCWDGPEADYRPDSDDIPWCRVPEAKITPEDVKYALSGHYQGTPYDPYARHGDGSLRGSLRPIGVNRNNFLSLVQIRQEMPEATRALEWIAFGSNVFNALVPLFSQVDSVPFYFENTGDVPSTDSFYWANRMIAALADPHFGKCANHIERYQMALQSEARAIVLRAEKEAAAAKEQDRKAICEKANAEIAALTRKKTDELLSGVLLEASFGMKNAFARSDA
ncbi:MAG: C69 family dipeptidase [Clostridia bacterium]|nr:C69 family dipeptidase [Clostridia bacterium]